MRSGVADVCSMALNVEATNWTQVAGGLNALFTNLAGDRVANVTLSCGPMVALQALDTAPSGSGGETKWLTHRLPNSVAEVWVWDMWFATSALPAC